MYATDIAAILARRHDNGADFWATADGRICVGNPFSTLAALGMLHELGVRRSHEAVRGGLGIVLAAWRDDGRFRLAPNAPLYPCYTAEAARILCRHGLSKDRRLQRTATNLLEGAHESGEWRCSFSKFGRGPETQVANPGATLFALDVLRFTGHVEAEPAVDRALESLLRHWETRKRCGPCHYGIGSRFMEVEYPFLRYNIFYYVYVLSRYPIAAADPRFHEAAKVLTDRLDEAGRLVVERPHRGLKGLGFCERGKPSEPAPCPTVRSSPTSVRHLTSVRSRRRRGGGPRRARVKSRRGPAPRLRGWSAAGSVKAEVCPRDSSRNTT